MIYLQITFTDTSGNPAVQAAGVRGGDAGQTGRVGERGL